MRPHTSYLICATPRTGSYLLCEALTKSGLAGQPAEYFWRGHESIWRERWGATNYQTNYQEYVAGAFREASTPNGVFGMKTMWEYMDYFLGRLRQLPDCAELEGAALLSHVFPNLHYIWMRRGDKVRQAISNWRAIKTGQWMQKEDDGQATAALTFDFDEVHAIKEQITRHEDAWWNFFREAGIEPLIVVYEDFVPRYEETALRIIRYLNVPIPPTLVFERRHLQKQADEQSEAWVEEYHRIKERHAVPS